MSRALANTITAALKERTLWEERQLIWRQMRRDGLRRKKKPYTGAADLHFPLIRMQIEKLKPFYYGQAFASDQLARFGGLVPELRGAESAAAEFFDWTIKNQTNFQSQLFYLIDLMLLSGRGVIKVRWDRNKERIDFESLDPLFVIVPPDTVALEDAPWVCFVKQMTKEQYRDCGDYEVNEHILSQISGKQVDETGDQDKLHRAGINEGTDDNQVVLWEVWQNTGEKGWLVKTMAPKAPDLALRMPFTMPQLGAVDFPFELAEQGWYNAMGVAEHQAPFEQWCNKQWNAKADAMDFYNKPLFTHDGQIPNTKNITFEPGGLIEGIKAVDMPSPPISFDQEMLQTHRLAQEAISMPDANMGSINQSRDNPTAREVAYRQQLSGQGVTMRGMIFRQSLARLYRLAWGLMIQHMREQAAAFGAMTQKVLPMQAMVENFLIEPDGSVDTWNREFRRQKSAQRMQMLAGHPNIVQSELVKTVLEDDDPRLVKRLWKDDAQKQQLEQEDEAMEIVLLMSGYPAQVNPGENHQLRIALLTSKLQQLAMTGAPVDPIARQRIQEHIAQHIAALQQENPALARQIEQAATELDAPQPIGLGEPPMAPPAIEPEQMMTV